MAHGGFTVLAPPPPNSGGDCKPGTRLIVNLHLVPLHTTHRLAVWAYGGMGGAQAAGRVENRMTTRLYRHDPSRVVAVLFPRPYGFRGRRFAPTPANGWHPSGVL